ncbi:MAG: hypothetical protein HQK53_13345 [Oligoflexia bacterium]|nr:hypothetical protein [Oligoflexia bacterium]
MCQLNILAKWGRAGIVLLIVGSIFTNINNKENSTTYQNDVLAKTLTIEKLLPIVTHEINLQANTDKLALVHKISSEIIKNSKDVLKIINFTNSYERKSSLKMMNHLGNMLNQQTALKAFHQSGFDNEINTSHAMNEATSKNNESMDGVESKILAFYYLKYSNYFKYQDCLQIIDANLVFYKNESTLSRKNIIALDLLLAARLCIQKDRERFLGDLDIYRNYPGYTQLLLATE